ncbi:hypothetical protein [Spirillospora sp. NPDC029432]|uniref:hypothetical protein n=1 Tax=Spirillospora sp. NPDC029432 TaxID=3154599 RepID=UPI003452D2C8
MSELPQPPQQAVSASYEPTTASPVVYLPVMLDGDHVGYLWAGVDDRSATFIRRNEFLDRALETPFVWIRRLREAHERGLPAREAIREWIGRPADPVGGEIPADAQERVADRLADLSELANPGERRPPWAALDEDLFSGGADRRPPEQGPLDFDGPPSYDLDTDGPVRYLPVVKDEVVLGYLWASAGGNAAMYLPRADAGLDGSNAATAWILRLRDLYAADVPAGEVLGRCRGVPDDGRSGTIAPDVREEEAESLQELERLASVYEQSLRVSYLPAKEDPQVAARPPLTPEEREAVLDYLRDAPVVFDRGDLLVDEFDPAEPARIPDTFHTDGLWVWLGGVAYHLETHGIPPEPDLVEHIRRHDHRLPEVDAVGTARAERTLRWTGFLVPPLDLPPESE